MWGEIFSTRLMLAPISFTTSGFSRSISHPISHCMIENWGQYPQLRCTEVMLA